MENMQNFSTCKERTEHCCREHRRRLELFCQEDEMFICVQCVPTHSSHSFIFLREAGSMYKGTLTAALSFLESKVDAFQEFQKRLEKEFLNVLEDSHSLEQHITMEFAKLQQFLLDHEYKRIHQLQNIEGEILKEIEENLECIKNYMIIQEGMFDVRTKTKMEDAEVLMEREDQSEVTKSDDMTRHEALSDVNFECENEETVTLKEIGENPNCSENSVITSQDTVFGNLWNKNGEAEMSKMMKDQLECFQNDITQAVESDVILEIKRKEAERLKKTRENAECINYKATVKEVPDANFLFKCEEGEILIETEKYNVAAKEKFHGNLQLKNEETDSLKKMEENIECIKQHIIPSQEGVSNVNMDVEEQDPFGFLTVPEAFEDVAVKFSREEWRMMSKNEKVLHREVMLQNYEHMVSLGYNIPREQLLLLLGKPGEVPFNINEEDTTMFQPDLPPVTPAANRYVKQTENQSPQSSVQNHMHSKYDKLFTEKMQTHVEGNPYKCSVQMHHGKELFPQWSDLSGHENIHTDEEPSNCASHDQNFVRKDPLSTHEKVHIALKPHTCVTCDKSFTRKSNLLVHEKIHTKEKLKCATCGRSFLLKLHLLAHEKTHVKERSFKCPTLGKNFSCKRPLEMHEKRHITVKPHKCATCGKNFSLNTLLSAHEKRHIRVKPYKCTTCDKSFAKKMNLLTHENIHTGEKPYKCKICEKRFSDKSNCSKHEIVHTGERQHKCATCGKSFVRKSHLSAHEKTHTGMKPYKCTTCEKSFSLKATVLLHEKKHSGEKPYKCATCDEKFVYKCKFYKHEKMHIREHSWQT